MCINILAQFMLQPQYTENSQNLREGVIANADFKSCSKELLCLYYNHDPADSNH